MFVVIVGAGKVGRNTGRLLRQMGYEVMVVEQRRMVYDKLAEEFQESILLGDGTEIWVLDRAGIGRADMVVAVTGDDEDNIIISQIARLKYGVPKVVARVNNPFNQPTFDLLGVDATVCAATRLLSMIEHELPEHKLGHLLNLKRENIELVDLEVSESSPFANKKVYEISLPDGVLLSAILRDGTALLARGSETILPGDQVLCLLEPGKEKELISIFLPQESPETVQAEADLDVEKGIQRQ